MISETAVLMEAEILEEERPFVEEELLDDMIGVLSRILK